MKKKYKLKYISVLGDLDTDQLLTILFYME